MELVLGVVWYAVLLLSLTMHEAAHAWAAKRGGDLTAYHGGQVSLDPRPHIRREPFGMVMAPIMIYAVSGWMIGWASTPYDPAWARAYPRRAAWMSLAGPASNLLLVVVAALGIRAGLSIGLFHAPASIHFTQVTAASAPGFGEGAALVLSVLFTLNLVLLTFNLFPLPPLDGAGVLPLLMSKENAERYRLFMSQPVFSLLGILIAWQFFGKVFAPIHLAAIRLLYPEVSYG